MSAGSEIPSLSAQSGDPLLGFRKGGLVPGLGLPQLREPILPPGQLLLGGPGLADQRLGLVGCAPAYTWDRVKTWVSSTRSLLISCTLSRMSRKFRSVSMRVRSTPDRIWLITFWRGMAPGCSWT